MSCNSTSLGKFTAPCGHVGTPVIGTFVTCTVKNCDGLPGNKCNRCSSSNLYVFTAPHLPEGTLACRDCGSLRWSGI